MNLILYIAKEPSTGRNIRVRQRVEYYIYYTCTFCNIISTHYHPFEFLKARYYYWILTLLMEGRQNTSHVLSHDFVALVIKMKFKSLKRFLSLFLFIVFPFYALSCSSMFHQQFVFNDFHSRSILTKTKRKMISKLFADVKRTIVKRNCMWAEHVPSASDWKINKEAVGIFRIKKLTLASLSMHLTHVCKHCALFLERFLFPFSWTNLIL